MKNLLTAAACLAALAAPPPAAAYPDAAAAAAVDVGGVSLTVMRDNRDPLLWYYLPASFIVAGAQVQRPEFFLIKGQAPAADGKIEDQAALLAALNLGLPPDFRQKAAAAVAALAGQADPKAVKLACPDITEAKLVLLDAAGAALAEADPDPSYTPLQDPSRIAFTAFARGGAAAKLAELLDSKDGLRLRLDYAYAAGPGPDFRRASVSGAAGFGDYKQADKDKAILTLPAGQPESVFLKLPQISRDAGITQATLALQQTDKDGKPLREPAIMFVWRAQDGDWKDNRGEKRILVPMPVKTAFASGLKRADIWLKLESNVILAGNKTEKALSKAPLFSADLPLSLPPSPFRPLTVSADHASFAGMSGLLLVQVSAKCDNDQENFVLRTNKEGTLTPEPVTVFFKSECRSLSLTAGYVEAGGGKRTENLSPGAGARLVYLQAPK